MNVQEYAELVAAKFTGKEQYNVMKHNTERLITTYLIKETGVGYIPNIFFADDVCEYWEGDTEKHSEISYDTLYRYYGIITKEFGSDGHLDIPDFKNYFNK